MIWHRQIKVGVTLATAVMLGACSQAGQPGGAQLGQADATGGAAEAQAALPSVIAPADAGSLVPGSELVPAASGYSLMTRGGRSGGGSFFVGTSGHGGSHGSRPGGGGSGTYHGSRHGGGDRYGRYGDRGHRHGGGYGYYGRYGYPWYGGYGWNYGFNRYYDSLFYYPYGDYMFPFYRGLGGAYYPYTGVDSPYLQYTNGAWQPQTLAAGQAAPAATANQAWFVIQGNQFFPKEASLTPGTTVVFYNADSTPHQIRSEGLGGIDTGVIQPGKSSAPIQVTSAGTIRFGSVTSPQAVGTMTVR